MSAWSFSRTIGDELGEAKASGNLGNTLKLLGRYDEAVVCCQRHLDITRAIYDKAGHSFWVFLLLLLLADTEWLSTVWLIIKRAVLLE